MTAHFFTNTKVASEAYCVAVDAMDGIDHAYRQAEAQLKSLSKQRDDLSAKRDAALKYLRDNQRYHVGDIFENRSGSKYVLSLVIEDVNGDRQVFGYLVGIGEAHSGNAGGRWSDSKGSIESSASTECFRSGLTRAQFEKIASRAADEFKLIGTTSTTVEGRPEARGLKRLKLAVVPA